MADGTGIDLEAQLEEARKQIHYYKRLAREAGTTRLRETEELSSLIRELRKVRQDLEQERQRFQSLAEEAPYAMAMISSDGRFLYANPKFTEMFGYDLSDIPTGRDWFRRAYPDSQYRHEVIAAWLQDISNSRFGEQHRRVFIVICKDGRKKVIHFRPVLLQTGEHLMTCEDITERWQAEEKLRQSEEEFRRIIENLQDPFYRADMNGVLTFLSPASERVAGYKPEEGIGRPLATFYADPDERQEFVKLIMEKGFVNDFVARLVHKDGHIVWVSTSARIYKDKDGNIAGVEGIARDITERKRSEEALRESEQRFRSLIDQAADGIFVHDLDGRFLEVNQQACRSLGYTYGELLSMSVSDIDPDAENRGDRTKFWVNLPATVEARHRRKDGTIFPVEVRLGPIEYAGTRVVLGVTRDISDRKHAEEALRNKTALLNSLIDALPDAVYFKDLRRRFLLVNKGYEAFFGSKSQEVVGRTVEELMSPEGSVQSRETDEVVIESKSPICAEQHWHDQSGAIHTFETRKFPILDDQRKIVAVGGISRDITLQKAQEKELIEAKILAESASRAKSEFLANMSHELRTPLNAIIGFSEILTDQLFGTLNEAQQRYVGHILESGRHLLRLVGQVLDLSKIDSGGVDIDLSPVCVGDLLQKSLAIMREQVSEPHLDLELSVDPEIEHMMIRADELRLKQVMFNLLSNAMKFTPENGRIRVEARTIEGEVVVSVSDTGVGINEADASRIFKAFEQVDSTLSRHHEGTGLGLALARKLVEMHGGRIWVESEGPGKGSSFRFAIPLEGRLC